MLYLLKQVKVELGIVIVLIDTVDIEIAAFAVLITTLYFCSCWISWFMILKYVFCCITCTNLQTFAYILCHSIRMSGQNKNLSLWNDLRQI